MCKPLHLLRLEQFQHMHAVRRRLRANAGANSGANNGKTNGNSNHGQAFELAKRSTHSKAQQQTYREAISGSNSETIDPITNVQAFCAANFNSIKTSDICPVCESGSLTNNTTYVMSDRLSFV